MRLRKEVGDVKWLEDQYEKLKKKHRPHCLYLAYLVLGLIFGMIWLNNVEKRWANFLLEFLLDCGESCYFLNLALRLSSFSSLLTCSK